MFINERMNLKQVCEWLDKRGMGATAALMAKNFLYHTWTVDGMLRTDVIKDVFAAIDQSGQLFRELECDVVTQMDYVPEYEAYVD
jgi:hypothetical protein